MKAVSRMEELEEPLYNKRCIMTENKPDISVLWFLARYSPNYRHVPLVLLTFNNMALFPQTLTHMHTHSITQIMLADSIVKWSVDWFLSTCFVMNTKKLSCYFMLCGKLIPACFSAVFFIIAHVIKRMPCFDTHYELLFSFFDIKFIIDKVCHHM